MGKLGLVGLVLAGLFLTMLAGCSGKVSKGNYDKIQNGMTRAEVEKILGKPTEEAGGGGVAGEITGSAKVLTWADGEKSIMVTFVNDKVTLKAQTGL